jgi:hypothetical protein
MKKPWHLKRDAGRSILYRQPPPRFDISAEVFLICSCSVSQGRLAHQVRQDLWRALQNQRGFCPVVEVEQAGTTLRIRAGGRLPAPIAPNMSDRILAVLEDPQKQMRWIRHATCKRPVTAPLAGVRE